MISTRHITIIAPGSQGDVRPYVALGEGLLAAGCSVRVATHQNFAALVTGCGLAFYPLHGDMEALLRDQAVADALGKKNPLAQLSLMKKKLVVMNEQWMRDCLEACQGAELVTGGFGGLIAGQPVAEKLGLPFIQAWLAPFTPTRPLPCHFIPHAAQEVGRAS